MRNGRKNTIVILVNDMGRFIKIRKRGGGLGVGRELYLVADHHSQITSSDQY